MLPAADEVCDVEGDFGGVGAAVDFDPRFHFLVGAVVAEVAGDGYGGGF